LAVIGRILNCGSLSPEVIMQIRAYQPGDELSQARIYNTAAHSLPGFKPAKPDEVARRIHSGAIDPRAMFYATQNGEVVGYAAFSSNGRISVPWSLPDEQIVREPLLATMVAEMNIRGLAEAWAAYRADWSPVLDFLREHGFTATRSMINYVAETSRIRALDPLPSNRVVACLERDDLPRLAALAPTLFSAGPVSNLEQFFWENPYYSFPGRLLALKDVASGELRGASLLVVDGRFADPTQIDPSMPCFRFGAFGTEGQRHKRVNGLFSCVFVNELDGDSLLAASLASLSDTPTLTHLAAQVASDATSLCAWHDRFFNRQGSFPIMSRCLSS
jgi:hypothetical protein